MPEVMEVEKEINSSCGRSIVCIFEILDGYKLADEHVPEGLYAMPLLLALSPEWSCTVACT
jgi:hypothetical protein